MTLNTSVWLHDQADATEVYFKCRTLLEAPDAVPVKVGPAGVWGEGIWTIGHPIGQGLGALLDIHYRPGAPLRTEDDALQHEDYCDEDCDGRLHDPAAWMEVTFDTAYGYSDEKYGGCGAYHAYLVAGLGRWLDGKGIDWSWENEFTGEQHRGADRYTRLADLCSGGEAATEWFRAEVLPAIGAPLPG